MPAEQTPRRWERYQGQTLGGAFALERLISSSPAAAVFLTQYEGRPAAIKLMPDDDAEVRLARWRTVSKLSHPHLLPLFRFGRNRVDDASLLFVVMEYADDSLAQVIPERPLSAVEAREMLEPVLSALAYLHAEGFVHGHLSPANILAVNDQLKISSDGISRIGTSGITPADDVRSLGATLVETLTQKPPGAATLADLENPFRDIAQRCLEPDPKARWTIADVQSRLGFRSREPQRRVRRRFLSVPGLLLAFVALVIAAILTRPWWMPESPPAATPTTTVVPSAQPASAVAAPAAPETPKTDVVREVPKPEPKTKHRTQAEARAPREGRESVKMSASAAGIGDEVMPDIPRKARNTIHGKMTLGVRVHVDPSGHVTEATLIPPHASKYFGELTLKAVRHWQFHPAAEAQDWNLRFDFFRSETKVYPERILP